MGGKRLLHRKVRGSGTEALERWNSITVALLLYCCSIPNTVQWSGAHRRGKERIKTSHLIRKTRKHNKARSLTYFRKTGHQCHSGTVCRHCHVTLASQSTMGFNAKAGYRHIRFHCSVFGLCRPTLTWSSYFHSHFTRQDNYPLVEQQTVCPSALHHTERSFYGVGCSVSLGFKDNRCLGNIVC